MEYKHSSDTVFCAVCGSEVEADSPFCPYCGSPVDPKPLPGDETAHLSPEYQPPYYSDKQYDRNDCYDDADILDEEMAASSVYAVSDLPSAKNLPKKYRPLSHWEYFGLALLFLIPVIGWIFIFVLSFSNRNINRRNFAMSFLCFFLLFGLILLVVSIFFPEQLQDLISAIIGLF